MGMLDDPAVLEELLRKALTTQETKPNWSTGMLAAGLGMLANNRGNFGEAFGRGGLMGLQAMQDDRQRQQRDPMQQLQMAQTVMGMQGQLADRRGVQDFQGFVGAQPNVTREAMMRYLGHDSAKVREMAKTYLEQMEKGRKLKDTRTLTNDQGQRVTVNFFDDGSTETVPFAPDKEKLSFQSTGGQTLGLDPFTGMPATQYKHTPTPGDEMTDVRSREQYGLTEQRMRDQMAQSDRQHRASLGQAAAFHRDSLNKPHFVETSEGVFAVNPQTLKAATVEGKDGPLQNTKPPTEMQGKAVMFGARMANATEKLSALEQKAGFNPTSPLNLMAGASGVSSPMNYLASKDAQSYMQAQRDWSEAELRYKTGAVVTKAEIDDNVKVYFPQPGDSPETVKQKAASRAKVEATMRTLAGPGAKQIPQSGPPNLQSVTDELRRRGMVR